MKERPILMNGAMVRALLDGSKTQTRRPVKPAPEMVANQRIEQWTGAPATLLQLLLASKRSCPYGKLGDRLWVRETWYCDHFEVQKGPYLEVPEARKLLVYRADGERPYEAEQPNWHPSIHMPRWASRILLEIVSLRVERLNGCSVEDTLAEGITHSTMNDPRVEYQRLWDDINGTGAWAANPWVWAIEFKQVIQ